MILFQVTNKELLESIRPPKKKAADPKIKLLQNLKTGDYVFVEKSRYIPGSSLAVVNINKPEMGYLRLFVGFEHWELNYNRMGNIHKIEKNDSVEIITNEGTKVKGRVIGFVMKKLSPNEIQIENMRSTQTLLDTDIKGIIIPAKK